MRIRTVLHQLLLQLVLFALVILLVPALHAQDTQENPWRVAFFGAYSTTTSHAINSGFQAGAELRVTEHNSARLDSFKLNDANSTTVILARNQYQLALSHLVKPTGFVNTQLLLPFVNVGIGNASSAGGSKFAYAVGAGVDIQINSTVKVRALDMTYVRSTVFPGGGILLGNVNNLQTALTQIATGINLTF